MEKRVAERFLQVDFDEVQRPAYGLVVDREAGDSGWHAHEKFHQITYTVQGSLRFESRTRQSLLPARRAAIVPVGIEHRVLSARPVKLQVVYLAAEHFDLGSMQLDILGVPPLMKEMLGRAVKWGPDSNWDNELPSSFFTTFALMLPEWLHSSVPLHLPQPHSAELARAVEYTLDNLHRATFEQASHRAGLSQRSLSRRFQHEMGMSWRRFLQVARVLRGLELLDQTSARVSLVAAEVGFSSPSAFSSAFKKLMGVSPRDYR